MDDFCFKRDPPRGKIPLTNPLEPSVGGLSGGFQLTHPYGRNVYRSNAHEYLHEGSLKAREANRLGGFVKSTSGRPTPEIHEGCCLKGFGEACAKNLRKVLLERFWANHIRYFRRVLLKESWK